VTSLAQRQRNDLLRSGGTWESREVQQLTEELETRMATKQHFPGKTDDAMIIALPTVPLPDRYCLP